MKMKLIQFFLFFTCSLYKIDGDNAIINTNNTNTSTINGVVDKYRSLEVTDTPCEDNTEFFRIVTPTMQRIRKTCAWVKRDKTQWRCYNYENVLENCPETCGLCSASLPTEGPTSTSKSWCQNSDQKFVIESKEWFDNGERSCQWASKRSSRCDIVEVADHCPVLCDTCACSDKEGRFRMSNGSKRTCLWLKTKKNRLKRCDFDPEVIMHCPLTCGECTEETFVGTNQEFSDLSSSPSSNPSNFHSSLPSSKPTRSPTKTPTNSPTISPTNSPTRNPTKKPSRRPTRNPTQSPTKQPTRKPSHSPSINPSVEASGIPSLKPSLNPSHTPSSNPSDFPSVKHSQNPTVTPSASPTTEPSDAPTLHPTNRPSEFPTSQPSSRPSTTPSKGPSSPPSVNPSAKPSVEPSSTPTSTPSLHPTAHPSLHSSNVPSMDPTTEPTGLPSSQPTRSPTTIPSGIPSGKPSVVPSRLPTSDPSEFPSDVPSAKPSGLPSLTPTVEPSAKPSLVPSIAPSSTPTVHPSSQPTSIPSNIPSTTPSQHPSSKPTTKPSTIPTSAPSQIPSKAPSATPTTHPSRNPTTVPSISPSSTPSTPPSSSPSLTPSSEPSTLPSSNPSDHPTNTPSTTPTKIPSQHPSSHPSSKPSGLPTKNPSSSPSSIPSISGSTAPTPVFYDMNVGGYHSSAITYDGKLILWGRNRYGAIGDDSTTDRLSPVQIDIGTEVSPKQVDLGDEHSCVITNDNDEMKCFGHNNRGQIGDGTTSNRLTPTTVNFGSNLYATQIGAGIQHTCAILNDNSLKCWGSNAYGQVGDGTSSNHYTPYPVNFGSDVQVRDLSVGGYHSCLITIDNVLMCWGLNTNGQLGDGTKSIRRTPKVIDLDVDEYAVEIGTSNFHTCVITNLEKLKCWGSNSSGQIGDGTQTLRTTPTTVGLGLDEVPTKVALGEYHTCIILNDGTLECWGNNYYGQLGDGTRTRRPTPTTISLGTNLYAVKISAGNQHTCAVLNDGMLRCWGRNQYGEVGVGHLWRKNTPQEVYQLV